MLYISDSVARIVGLCLALTAALLTVFAVEKLTYLLSLALKFHVELPRFLLLYVAILPDVADFILPVTVVAATYLIVLRKREGREFLILSSAGTGGGRRAAPAQGTRGGPAAPPRRWLPALSRRGSVSPWRDS